MALNVKINFEERYEVDVLNDDLTSCSFTTLLKDDSEVLLGVQINSEAHRLMPDVYNLAFGPLNDAGQIDDRAKLYHADHSRVFSTIVFAGMSFLSEHPDLYLGIDGSNNARAYMYYRCIQNNLDYLSTFFVIYGVNYYVRFLRKAKDEDEYAPLDSENVVVLPEMIQTVKHIPCDKLYNYFIFKLKQE